MVTNIFKQKEHGTRVKSEKNDSNKKKRRTCTSNLNEAKSPLSSTRYAKIPSIAGETDDFQGFSLWRGLRYTDKTRILQLSLPLFLFLCIHCAEQMSIDFDMSCGWYFRNFSIKRSWVWQLSFLKSSGPLLQKIIWRAKLASMLSGNEK